MPMTLLFQTVLKPAMAPVVFAMCLLISAVQTNIVPNDQTVQAYEFFDILKSIVANLYFFAYLLGTKILTLRISSLS